MCAFHYGIPDVPQHDRILADHAIFRTRKCSLKADADRSLRLESKRIGFRRVRRDVPASGGQRQDMKIAAVNREFGALWSVYSRGADDPGTGHVKSNVQIEARLLCANAGGTRDGKRNHSEQMQCSVFRFDCVTHALGHYPIEETAI